MGNANYRIEKKQMEDESAEQIYIITYFKSMQGADGMEVMVIDPDNIQETTVVALQKRRRDVAESYARIIAELDDQIETITNL